MHRIALAASAALASGCFGDFTSSDGALGRLTYGLATDYEGEADGLDELPLLTRHTHRISVGLTAKGRDDAGGDAERITHRAEGAEVVTDAPAEPEEDDEADGDAPDFAITADAAGTVRVESVLEGEVFDRIDLTFADPTHLALVEWTRGPWETEWSDEAPARVREGTQVSFVAIPMADGVRLGGEFTPEIRVDPPELAVPDEQLLSVQEGGVTVVGEPVTFYLVEAGTVTFTLSDPLHGVEVARTFEVTPL